MQESDERGHEELSVECDNFMSVQGKKVSAADKAGDFEDLASLERREKIQTIFVEQKIESNT